MRGALTRVVSWGHELLAEILSAGQLTVDLTAGNGYDALMLWRQVAPSGQVVAFDVQPEALQRSHERLQREAVPVRFAAMEQRLAVRPGVDLVAAGHQHLEPYLPGPPQAVIANLGYLPGGDQRLITRPETTLPALEQAAALLAPKGRMAIVVYTGHEGAQQERVAVDGFFAALEPECFQVLQLKVANRPEAPYLLVAEKR